MNSKTLLIIAIGLIGVGLLKPDFAQFITKPVPNAVDIVVAPTSESLKLRCRDVIKALSVSSDRKTDGKRLSGLYNDIATLISLDGEDEVIRNTEEIRQANRLSGLMLHLDIKGKYKDLPSSAESLIKEAIGDDGVPLTPDLRAKAVEGFKALSWACNEGSK